MNTPIMNTLQNFALRLLTFLLIAQPSILRAEDGAPGIWQRWKQHFDWSAVVEAEWSGDGSATQKSEFNVEPEIEIDLPADWRLTSIVRLRGGDGLTEDHTDFELREFYVEGEIRRSFVTLGKQQIVWGKADGLKVLDVVNPQDFREFILDDFDDSRIPLWSAQVEIPLPAFLPGNDPTLQLLWIPDTTYHELARPGTAYEFTSSRLVPMLPAGIHADIRPTNEPNRFFADSDFGARFSTFWHGWDLTLNVLYHYNDLPTFDQHVGAGPTVVIQPKHERTLLAGGSFSNAFGDFALRGELAYSMATADDFTYVVGLDWFGLRDTLLSVQLFQSRLNDAPAGLLRRDIQTRASFLIRRDFLGERLITEVLWLQDLDEGDGLIRPEVRWELSDRLNTSAGLDLFYGDPNGLFGQFRDNDRLSLSLSWGL